MQSAQSRTHLAGSAHAIAIRALGSIALADLILPTQAEQIVADQIGFSESLAAWGAVGAARC